MKFESIVLTDTVAYREFSSEHIVLADILAHTPGLAPIRPEIPALRDHLAYLLSGKLKKLRLSDEVILTHPNASWRLESAREPGNRALSKVCLALRLGAQLYKAHKFSVLFLETFEDERNLRKHYKALGKAVKLKRKLNKRNDAEVGSI